MSDLTPSFINNQSTNESQYPNLYYISDKSYKNPPKSSSEYIKILEYEDEPVDSYEHFQDSTLSGSYKSPNELTFHPTQLSQMKLNPLQERNISSMNIQREISPERSLESKETNSGNSSIISGLLMDTFSKDQNAMKFLKQITGNSKENIENMDVNQRENVANNKIQGTKPPKYQPPKVKKEQRNVENERALQNIQEERREKEEDEELRPFENIPEPMKASKIEPEVINETKKLSKTLDKSLKRAKSPKQEIQIQPEEDKTIGKLKKFYGSLIGENKKNKERSLNETKRSMEAALFGDDKENFIQGKNDTQRSNKSKTVSFAINENVPERTTGSIVRRNSKTKETKEFENLDFYFRYEKEFLGKSAVWLNEKYKSRGDVLAMQENEMNEALEVLKTEKDWKGKVEGYIMNLIEVPEKDVMSYVDEEFDLEENREIIERLLKVKRNTAFYFIDFVQKFSHLGLLKEMAEMKNKIKTVNMGISKLRRENNKIQNILKKESNVSKKNTLKGKKAQETGLKRTSYQENETKILMMIDIRSRLTQKNVLLALKWVHHSAKTRNDLLETMNKAYNNKLLYHTMGSICFNKQYKANKKAHEELAITHMKQVWMRQLMEGWLKMTELHQQKRILYQGLADYSLEKLKKKGFYGILMLIQYKKVLKADIPLVERFNDYRLQKKAFLGLKNAADFEQIFKQKKQSFENFCAGKSIRDPREKPLREAFIKDSMKMAKVILNRLSILSSKREYYYEPLQNMKALLRTKYSEKKKQNNTMALPNLAQIQKQSQKIFENLPQNESIDNQQSIQALLYKKKRYVLNKLSHESVLEELTEHIRSLNAVRRTLEDSRPELPEAPKGVLNHQALEKFYKEREEKKIKGSLFNRWKIAFLEKWTNLETDLYHTMYVSKIMIQKLRESMTNKKKLQEDFCEERNGHLKRRVFKILKKGYDEMREEEMRLILQLRGRKIFEEWKQYYMLKKAKRNLYEKFLTYRHNKIKTKICEGWKTITEKNKLTREKTQWLIKKRTLKQWAKKYNNRVILNNVFEAFINKANYYSEHVPKNNFQLLSSIVKAWRNEVIENEHTVAQQVNILLAQNHRKHVMRVKVFRAWKEIPPRIKSLVMMTEIFKENFRKNIYKKWSYITQYTLCQLAGFQLNQQKLKVLRCFKALYRNGLQGKLVKCFVLRRFFLKWNASFHLRTELLPRRCYTNNLYRAFFNVLKNQRRQKIIELKHKFLAKQFYKKFERSLLQKAFYRFFENRLISLKKKTFKKRLALFHGNVLLKKAIKTWKNLKYLKFLKEKKKRIADAFRLQKQNLWLKPNPSKKNNKYSISSAKLIF